MPQRAFRQRASAERRAAAYLPRNSGHSHIRCSPHHPQTNGKLERFHETPKARVNLLVYLSPEELWRGIAEFIESYNHRRYHDGNGNVAPADLYYGRREAILKRREEQERVTFVERFR